MSASDAAPTAGLYGKLPSRGDFVRRRLPLSFVTPWDGWLQRGLAESEQVLGERWLATYLTSPLWRFALAAGLCGEEVAAGVLMPSVDAVGRHFPLTLAMLLPAGVPAFALPACGDGWFARLEEVALSGLDAQLDPDGIEAALGRLGRPEAAPAPPGAARRPDRSLRWDVAPDRLASLAGDLYPAVLDEVARADLGAYSVWWTLGSDDVAPSFRVYPGLPPVQDFWSLMTERPGGESAAAGRPAASVLSQDRL